MSERGRDDRGEAMQERLDPHRRDERARASAEVAARLRGRGVRLEGGESSEELVLLLDAVERFEREVEAHGGDLMVDEGPHGRTSQPDDPAFVLPRREAGESAAVYVRRVDEATRSLRRRAPRAD